ncbi:MAG: tetratricopeptide repeat protein [Gemmatimonadales bacterium]
MSDDIRSLTERLAAEPSSLAFLELGEALRRRGQLEAAYKVARGGASRYPGLADAHDLMARIQSDQADLAGAFDSWSSALQLDPMRISALKGLAFLYFRAGDAVAALDHLQRAAEVDPDDPSIVQALERVRREVITAGPPPAAEPTGSSPTVTSHAVASPPPVRSETAFDGIDGGEQGQLLVDSNGLRLGGSLTRVDGSDASDRVAAELAGASREEARATRLLGLGGWHSIALECPDGHIVLSSPTADTVLLTVRDHSLPMARVGLLAERAARAARSWLERLG